MNGRSRREYLEVIYSRYRRPGFTDRRYTDANWAVTSAPHGFPRAAVASPLGASLL